MTFLLDAGLPIALVLIMLGLGMSVEARQFRALIRQKRAMLLGVGSMLLVGPAVAIIVIRLIPVEPLLAVGLFLVASCPGGITSNLFTYLARGNVALSISLTSLLSLIYVATAPFLIGMAFSLYGLGQAHARPPGGMGLQILAVTLVPVGIGMFARARFAGFAQRIDGTVRAAGTLLIILVFATLVASDWDRLLGAAQRVMIPLTLISTLTVAIAYGLARAARLDRADATAICIEHAVRQEGTAIYATVALSGSALMALPLLLNSVLGALVAMAFITLTGGWGRPR